MKWFSIEGTMKDWILFAENLILIDIQFYDALEPPKYSFQSLINYYPTLPRLILLIKQLA